MRKISCTFLILLFVVAICFGCKPVKNPKVTKAVAIDKVTKQLAEAVENYDRLYNFHEGMALVKKNEKYGFINKLGEEIIPCIYDDAEDFNNGLAIVGKRISEDNLIYGCLDQNGSIIIPLKYENIVGFLNSVSPARIDGKEGAIDNTGKTIIPFIYESVHSYHEGLALVVNADNKYGYVDEQGKLVIPFKFNYEHYTVSNEFSDGLAAFENEEGKMGYIDKKGNVVIPCKFRFAKSFNRGLAAVGIGDINWDNSNGWTLDKSNAKSTYINKNGEIATSKMWDDCDDFSNQGYAAVRIDYEGFGIVDRNLNLILPCEYLIISPILAKNELIPVKFDKNQVGVFDAYNRKISIPCVYEDMAYGFFEGFIVAKKNEKMGYLDRHGNVVIPFSYDSASDFSEGFAAVERFGKWGYVDRYGNDTFSI